MSPKERELQSRCGNRAIYLCCSEKAINSDTAERQVGCTERGCDLRTLVCGSPSSQRSMQLVQEFETGVFVESATASHRHVDQTTTLIEKAKPSRERKLGSNKCERSLRQKCCAEGSAFRFSDVSRRVKKKGAPAAPSLMLS